VEFFHPGTKGPLLLFFYNSYVSLFVGYKIAENLNPKLEPLAPQVLQIPQYLSKGGQKFFFFFFFLHVHIRGGGMIWTSDLCFMRRNPSRLSYLLGTKEDNFEYDERWFRALLPFFLKMLRVISLFILLLQVHWKM
jgi:hypothetical protein